MGHKWALGTGALLLASTLSACGSTASSSPAGAGTRAPTNANRAEFCKTFVQLNADVDPAEISNRLDAVGTPSGISSQARTGFTLLVAHIRVLPDNPNNSDLTALVKGLGTTDRAAVLAFWKYYGNECEPVPSDSPS